jgi:branched-chain amino acid transport system substrate-binding protein
MSGASKLSRLVGALLLCCVAVSLAACGGGASSSSSGSSGSESSEPAAGTEPASEGGGGGEESEADLSGFEGKKPINFGLVVPLSGPAAVYGEDAEHGAQIAAEVLNEKGGVMGRPIKITTGDDQAVPTSGVNEMRRLVQGGAEVLIGGVTGDVATAEEAAEGTKLPLWLLSKLPTMTIEGVPMVLANNINFEEEAERYLPLVEEAIHPEKVAVLYENSESGQVGLEQFEKFWGDKLVDKDSFELNATDFSVILTKVKETEPDLVIIQTASDPIIGQMLKQIGQFGIDTPVALAAGTQLSQASIEAAGEAPGQVVYGDIYTPSLPLPTNKKFVEQFKSRYSDEPEKEAALTYEAVMITAEEIEKDKCTDCGEKLVAGIRGNTWNSGVRGPVAFDKGGLGVAKSYYFLEVTEGTIKLVKSA